MNHHFSCRSLVQILLCVVLPLSAVAAKEGDSYLNFESHQFHPLTLSPSRDLLFVANTPDNRIEIFNVTGDVPRHVAEVLVGLEPVAIAARSDTEIWVVNHLSDSVSVVDLSQQPPRVVRTLQVGDEPRDIVFAGKDNRYAYVTAAHRGQNSPYTDPLNPGELTTPGIGRADVWVFDAETRQVKDVLALFGDSPGPLAVSPDGSSVYAGIFKSGNQTTIVGRVLVCKGGAAAEPCEIMPGMMAPGGLPAPNENIEGIEMPGAGLIVKWDGEGWKDELGRDWSPVIKLDLPDYDVFQISADTDSPKQIKTWSGVGTILYAMAVNPVDQKLFVANTDALNEVRFEGSRSNENDISTVQGHLHETRISILEADQTQVLSRHLNPHIDYEQYPVPKRVRERSLSMPVALEFSADGSTLYVAAKGSDKIAVLDSRQLQSDSFKPSKKQHIKIPGGGPSGLALDESRGRLYVLSRFDNSLVVVATKNGKVKQHIPLFNPEPGLVRSGRPLFFNAFLTSGNGESSCASCHVAGDKDELAWDLGDPLDVMLDNPSKVVGPLKGKPRFHPMKGPMLTQTMRGIENHGPLHWRGDRTAGNDPGGDPLDTAGAMNKFNAAFVSLMGRDKPLNSDQMQALTDYSMRIIPPPNPIRALDDSLSPMQAEGKVFFERGRSVPGGATCASCHVVNRRRGWYGTRGMLTHIIGGRLTKIPHHRNTYERVGMFGRAPTRTLQRDGEHMGPQIRGYGFTHDGGADTTIRFMSYPAFRFPKGDEQRDAVEQYLFAFEANLKPIVGQQITLSIDEQTNAVRQREFTQRAQLFIQQARLGNADLVAGAVIAGEYRSFLFTPEGRFVADKSGESVASYSALLALVQKERQPLTLMAVPPGSGFRIALDRDLDGQRNRDVSL